MEKIFLTSENIKQSKIKYFGYESNIYEFDENFLMKIFKDDNQELLNNKLKKILLLSELDLDLTPLKLVFIDGCFKGYIYEELKGYYPIDGLVQKKKEKEKILLEIKEKLHQLHQLGIIYGDLHQQNILYNGSNIVICDLDNVSINNLKFDTKNNHIYYYMARINVFDTRLDSFIFNLLTISYYQNISYDYVITYLITQGKLSHKFNTSENRKIISEMICLTPDYSGELLIDNSRKKLTLK